MEVIQMAHAGTMDLGQNAKAARGGNPWLALAAIVAIMAATVGAIWFTSGAGLTTSSALAARPAADRSYDQIEAFRGAVVRGPVVDDHAYDQIESLRGTIAAPALTLAQVEQLRYGSSHVLATTSGLVIDGDHAYDPIENLRGGGAIVSDHTYDPIENLRGGAVVAGPGRFDAYDQAEKIRGTVAPLVVPAAVVVGPGDYGFEQFSQFAGLTGASTKTFPSVTDPHDRFGLGHPQMGAITGAPTSSATSGTFLDGKGTTTKVTAPRDRVGGP